MRYLKKIGDILLNIIFGVMFVIGVTLIILRVSGFKILAVETGSMGETLPVGSLIITENCSPTEIQSGDIISFVANESLLIVTHRVIEVDTLNRKFYTKGDANNTVDTYPVAFENLIGRIKFKIPNLGYIVIWSHTKNGKIIIFLEITLIMIIVGSINFKSHSRKESKK